MLPSATPPAPSVESSLASVLAATLQTEAAALYALAQRDPGPALQAVALMLGCKGRVVVCGIGKSGHIGRKIAATLASTGSPAFFLHAAEAAHGDLGMVTPADVMLALSYSGASDELLAILPAVRKIGVPIISLCGNAQSELVRRSDVHIDVSVEREACPLNLAPTASTTAMLAMGDALALACLQARGFMAEDFARSHPGGRLGRRLLVRVQEVMRPLERLPVVSPKADVLRALAVMSAGQMGMTLVCEGEQLLGIFTDGDLRRLIERDGDIRQHQIADVMHLKPLSISPDALAAEAAQIMDQHRISQLAVLRDGSLVGALHMHDLLAAGVL